jgi:hypothetical protein
MASFLQALTAPLRKRMIDILTSPAAQKIDFYLDGFHVNGAGFAFVALALAPKPVGVRGLGIRIGHVSPGAEANYDTIANRYEFPTADYGKSPFQRTCILHESVHALRDCSGPKIRTSFGAIKTTSASDEAAAYIAGALFHIYDAPPGSGSATPDWAETDEIYATAHVIAEGIYSKPGFAVPPGEAKSLRDAVTNSYGFIKKNPKISYPNNGVSL